MNTRVHPLMKQRWYMYITQFVSGMSVMAVELGASRLIAPYFSSSQIVWTIIIGSIMIAMAIGNFLGGKLADKHPSIGRLYFFMLLSGTWITLIPFLGRFVIAGITALFAMIVNSGLLIWASFFTCIILFIPPLLLLGMVTPSLIKYAQKEGSTSGRVVGILEALGTVGSILGTFLPTFLTIPTIGTAFTFLIFGVILFALGAVYFIVGWIDQGRAKKEGQLAEEKPEEKKERKKDNIGKSIAVSLCLIGTVLGGVLSRESAFAFWDSQIIYTGESIYNYLQIRKDKNSETYYFSTNVMFSFQSIIRDQGNTLTGAYYDYAMAAPMMVDDVSDKELDVLVLGMAMGAYGTQLEKFFPDYKFHITGVEIDEKMIGLAKQYFFLPDDIEMVCDDGRSYLAYHPKKYDVIMLDAYSGISVPFQMASKEFFVSVQDHLNVGGVVVSNINMVDNHPGSIDQALAETMKNVFPSVYSYTLGGGSSNRELFASNSPKMISNLGSRIPSLSRGELKSPFSQVHDEAQEITTSSICLTDDNADVELRSMSAIDGIIQDSVAQYRAIFKERGLWGLIQYLLS